jgi:hypothetical protein
MTVTRSRIEVPREGNGPKYFKLVGESPEVLAGMLTAKGNISQDRFISGRQWELTELFSGTVDREWVEV